MTAGVGEALGATLAAHVPAVEAAMAALADELLRDAPDTVARPVRYAIAGGGKRLRPLLCIAAYRAVSGDDAAPDPGAPRAIHRLAAALEWVHTYSLVHDDLPCMDDDDLRRGRPSVHRAFDVPRATVAGAALLSLAIQAFDLACRELALPAAARAALVRDACQAAGGGGMVGGQWLDLEAEGRRVSAAELEGIHRRKTGALLAASVRIGARAAGADAPTLAALDRYGRAVGLAFQIADDVLDVTGSAERLGKNAGRDAELAKATFPALLGLEAARRRAEEEAEAAIAALGETALRTEELVALARFAVRRDR